MEKEVRLRNKLLHKLGLYLVKMIPIIISVLYLLNTILSYYGLHLEVFSMIGGMSLLPWFMLLVYSKLLQFCFYHRLFLYYILINESMRWYDYKIGFPVSDLNYLFLQLILSGIFLILIVIFKFKL